MRGAVFVWLAARASIYFRGNVRKLVQYQMTLLIIFLLLPTNVWSHPRPLREKKVVNQASNRPKNHWLEDGNMRIILAFTALLFPHLLNSSYTTEILRPAFEKTFADRCNPQKYPFMERYYQNLENPSDRFVHFVFHEHGLKNGGFGDRYRNPNIYCFILYQLYIHSYNTMYCVTMPSHILTAFTILLCQIMCPCIFSCSNTPCMSCIVSPCLYLYLLPTHY